MQASSLDLRRHVVERLLFYILPTIKGVIIFTDKSDKILLLSHDFGNVLIEKQKPECLRLENRSNEYR